jgi:hypothetical protein
MYAVPEEKQNDRLSVHFTRFVKKTVTLLRETVMITANICLLANHRQTIEWNDWNLLRADPVMYRTRLKKRDLVETP